MADSISYYVYEVITQDPTLAGLLADGNNGYHLYPSVVPEAINIETAVAFELINTTDTFPKSTTRRVQFNIFAEKHTKTVEVANALHDRLQYDRLRTFGGVSVVRSQRSDESGLGYDYDIDLYQREATYDFKLE